MAQARITRVDQQRQRQCRSVGQRVVQRRGFTLVELLVVVSIIALLISILLPSLKQAREQAKMVKCLAHSRGMGQAAMTLAAENNGRMQLATDQLARSRVDPDCNKYLYGSARQTSEPKQELLAWPVALARASGINLRDNWNWGVRATSYTNAKSNENLMNREIELAMCPSDRVRIASPYYPRGSGLVGMGDPRKPTPPGGNVAYWGYLSYGLNEDVCGADLNPNGTGNGGGPGCWKGNPDPNGPPFRGETGNKNAGTRLEGQLDKIFDPASVILMIDAGRDTEADDDSGFANLLISAQSMGPDLPHFHHNWKLRLPEKRHPKGALGVTYADGHGGGVRPSEFIEVTAGRFGKFKIPTRYSGPTRISPYKPINVPPVVGN